MAKDDLLFKDLECAELMVKHGIDKLRLELDSLECRWIEAVTAAYRYGTEVGRGGGQ